MDATETLLALGPTFPLSEVADVTGIAPQLLRDWVADGVVVPAVTGGKGRGNSHRFSVQQLVGLAIGTAWFKSPRGCQIELLREEVLKYEAWSLSAIQGLLQVLPDEFTEESFRKQMPKTPVTRVYELVPSHFEDVFAIYKVLVKLKSVVLNKLDAGGRITTKIKK